MDGCPHWHILLFCTDECERHIRAALLSAMREEGRDAKYIVNHERDFIKTRAVDLNSSGLSYIFKNAFAWRDGCAKKIEHALRQKAAISCAGVSQFQTIGANGFLGIVDKLYKALSDDQASPEVRKFAVALRDSNMQRSDLMVMRSLFTSRADEIEVVYSTHVNRFGEPRRKAAGIKIAKSINQIDSTPAAVTGNDSSNNAQTNKTINPTRTMVRSAVMSPAISCVMWSRKFLSIPAKVNPSTVCDSAITNCRVYAGAVAVRSKDSCPPLYLSNSSLWKPRGAVAVPWFSRSILMQGSLQEAPYGLILGLDSHSIDLAPPYSFLAILELPRSALEVV